MTIFISCGHNNARNWINDHGKFRLGLYRDNGATSGKYSEYGITKVIVGEIMTKIPTSKIQDYKFVPEGLNLQERIKWINDRAGKGDICIELHLDSAGPTAEGCSTWYYGGYSLAQEKAKQFQMEYTRVTGIRGRGVHGDNTNRLGRLGFVRDTKPLAFLVELGFITSQNDRTRIYELGADGILSGLSKIL